VREPHGLRKVFAKHTYSPWELTVGGKSAHEKFARVPLGGRDLEGGAGTAVDVLAFSAGDCHGARRGRGDRSRLGWIPGALLGVRVVVAVVLDGDRAGLGCDGGGSVDGVVGRDDGRGGHGTLEP